MEVCNEFLQANNEKDNFINEIKKCNNQLEDNQNNNQKSLIILDCDIENGQDELFEFINTLNTTSFSKYEKNNISIVSTNSEIDLVKAKLEDLQIKFETNNVNVNEDVFESYISVVETYKEKSNNNNLEINEENFKMLKICYDYLNYKLQKIQLDKDLGFTARTFILEGYIENDKKQELEDLMKSKNLCVSYEFSKPTNSDNVPTKTKNKKFVKPFEFVTNMYSVPKYNEIDPNFLLGLFFSLFFGFIMADIGYGILLVAIGLFLVLKKGTNHISLK